MDFKPIAESSKAHVDTWSDIAELHYWARKLKMNKTESQKYYDMWIDSMLTLEKW